LAVVGVRDGSVSLLARRVPNLRPDLDVLDGYVVRGELHSNRCMRLSFELVFRVSKK
jgi:hypothetical protein